MPPTPEVSSKLLDAVRAYVEKRYGFIGLTRGYDLTDEGSKETFIRKMAVDVEGVMAEILK